MSTEKTVAGKMTVKVVRERRGKDMDAPKRQEAQEFRTTDRRPLTII